MRAQNEWRLVALVVFVCIGVAIHLIATGIRNTDEIPGILGGPATVKTAVTDLGETLLAAPVLVNITVARSDIDAIGFIIMNEAAALGANSPLGGVVEDRDGLLTYKIQEGDTISRVASHFGISVETILWENSDVRANFITPGETIVILPISGVTHEMQEGETLESIAARYRTDYESVKSVNKQNAVPGDTIVVPGASPVTSGHAYTIALPDLAGYFSLPVRGWNWGRLHEMNAVDIANACGTPLYASAEGLIEEVSSNNAWNKGYGNYILIKHPNGTKTRYAHNSKNVVAIGEYVSRGDLIAYIGNTGNVHGPTGCHVHFEIYGAKNPFAK